LAATIVIARARFLCVAPYRSDGGAGGGGGGGGNSNRTVSQRTAKQDKTPEASDSDADWEKIPQ
jgi:hypothetical protein